MPTRLNLKDQRFGRLTAQTCTVVRKHKSWISYWNCICDCGKTVTVQANSLRRGTTRSCGCLSSELAAKRRSKNRKLTGQTFGRWLVIGLQHSYNMQRYRIWRCQCTCGTIKQVTEASLINKTSKSCGCLAKDTVRANSHDKAPGYKTGRTGNGYGYIKILRPVYKPNQSHYILEHHAVMIKHLGRALYPDERVHHKNGIRSDNRLANLELLRAGVHAAGQRVSDITQHSLEHLRRYHPEFLTTEALKYMGGHTTCI